MKKKLTLVLSIVLVLAVAVCAMIFASATSESSTHFAQIQAKERWTAAKDYWSTKVWFNNTAITDGATGKLSDLLGTTSGANDDSTYSLKDGVLTLSGSGETVNVVDLGADGALWIVLDNISTDGRIRPYYKGGWNTLYGNNTPTHDMPLIISSPIDADFNVLTPDATENIGGMVTLTSTANNAIRAHGTFIMLGDVGFSFGTSTSSASGDSIVALNERLSSGNAVLILSPGRDSSVTCVEKPFQDSNGRSIRCGDKGVAYILGSIFDDNTVSISLPNWLNVPAGLHLDDNANVKVFGTNANVHAGTGGIEMKDNSVLVVETTAATPVTLPDTDGLEVDATSTLYYKQGNVYTFPVAGNYKTGNSVFTATAGMTLEFANDLTFVRTSDAATVGVITHTDANGVVTNFVDLPENGATSVLNGAVSYDTDTKTVTLNGVTGNSLLFNIPSSFTVDVQGENTLGTQTLTYVVKSAGKGNMTVTGTGSLTVNAKLASVVVQDGAYIQNGADVTINNDPDAYTGNAIWANTKVQLHGGSLNITGSCNYAIYSKTGTEIAAESGKSVYVTIDAYANVISGGDVTIAGDEYDADAKTGTYLKITTHQNAESKGGDHGIRAANVTISGGTVDVSAKNNSIRASSLLTVTGGNVTATSTVGGDAFRGVKIVISDGTVNATAATGRAIYGETSISISGGTVTATSPATANVGTIYAATSYTQTGGNVTAETTDGAAGNALRAKTISISQASDDNKTVLKAYTLGSSHAVFVDSSGTLTLDGGEFTAISKNNRAVSYDNASFIINGGKFSTYGDVNGEELWTNYGACGANLKVTGGTVDAKGRQNNAFSGFTSTVIEGGTIDVYSYRGSIHSNNSVKISGGTLTLTTQNSGVALSSGNTMEISGGTVTVNAIGNGINAVSNVLIKDAAKVYAYSSTANAMSAPNVEIAGGEVYTYLVDAQGNPSKYSKYGITSTTGSLKISGGTVDAHVSENNALAVTEGNIKILGGTVTAEAPVSPAVAVNKGDLVVSDNGNLTVNVGEGVKAIMVGGSYTEVDPDTTEEVTKYYPGNLTVLGGKLTVTPTGAVSKDNPVVSVSETITVADGTFMVETAQVAWAVNVITAKNVNVTGGKLDGTLNGNGTFVRAENTINISNGTVSVVGTGNGAIRANVVNISDSAKVIVDAKANAIWGIGSGSTLTVSGGNVDIVSVDDHAVRFDNVVISGGEVNLTAKQSAIGCTDTLSVTNGTVHVSTQINWAINAKTISVEGGTISADCPEGKLFRVYDGAILSITGGKVVGEVGYFASYNNNENNRIVIEDDAYIDILYLNGKPQCSDDGGIVNDDRVASDIWLEGCGWTNAGYWLTTGNWIETSEPRVLLTLKDGSIFGLTLVVGGNRYYPNETDPIFTLSATGELINLKGEDVAAGEILKIKANGDLVLELTDNTVLNLGSENSTEVLEVLGNLTVKGNGKLVINAKSNGISVGGTYTQLSGDVAIETISDSGISAKDIVVSGGTVSAKSEKYVALKAANSITVTGDAVVNAYAVVHRALNAASVTISGGEVNTFFKDGDKELRSKYGITAENGNLTISGGKVNAHVTANSALFASVGEITISDTANVSVIAKYNGIRADKGDIKISGGTVVSDMTEGFAVKAGGNMSVTGGTLTVSAVSADKEGAVNVVGTFTQDGGTVTVTAKEGSKGYALNAAHIVISQSEGKTTELTARSVAGRAIVASDSLTINDGTITAVAKDRAISVDATAEGTITINGGTVKTYGKMNDTDTEDTLSGYGIIAQNIVMKDGTVDVKVKENSAFSGWKTLTVDGGTVNCESGRGSLNSALLTINGGTVNAKIIDGLFDDGKHSVTGKTMVVNGGVLNAYATSRSINVESFHMTNGTVNTYYLDDKNVEVCSRYGITATKGDLTISGGKVNAHVTANSAMLAEKGNVNISDTAEVSVSAISNGIVSKVGKVTVSGGTVDIAMSQATGINAANIDILGGTVTATGKPHTDEIAIIQTAGTYNQDGGTVKIIATANNDEDRAKNGYALHAANIVISQSEGKTTELTAICPNQHSVLSTGNMTVNGGVITSISENQRAITVDSASAGTLTINGGTLKTYGKVKDSDTEDTISKYGIVADIVVMNGGTVDANVKSNQAFTGWASLTVNGGSVTSKSASGSMYSQKLIEIRGGTVITETSNGYSVSSSDKILVGGNAKVYLSSPSNRAMNAVDIEIAGGEVYTYHVDEQGNPIAEKISAYGITTTTGTLKISGGTVIADVKNNSALCAYTEGNIEISGGNVTAKAPGSVVAVNKGDLVVSANGNLTVEANTGAYGISIGSSIKEKDPETGEDVTVGYQPGNVIVSGGTLNASTLASGRAIQINNGALNISGGIVNATSKKDNAVAANNVLVSGGELNVNAGSTAINCVETFVLSDGNVFVSANGGALITGGTSATVSGGVLNVRDSQGASLFSVKNGAELNLTGGQITGIVGTFILYDNNAENKITINENVYMDVCYLNDSFRNAALDSVLNENIAENIWLQNCGWSDSSHWLTTGNWSDGTLPTPRVILTLKDDVTFEMTAANRWWPSYENPIFTMTMQGDLVNLGDKSVAEGEILRIDAYENLNFYIPEGTVINLGSDSSSKVLNALKDLTLIGKGTLKINAKQQGIVVGGTYTQTETAVEIKANGSNGIKATQNINILGGSLIITGKTNGGLSAKTVTISSESGKSTYVDIKGHANGMNNVADGALYVYGDIYDEEAKTGTYLKVETNSDHGIRMVDVYICGGTVDASAGSQAIRAQGGNVVIEGGKVKAVASGNDGIEGNTILISQTNENIPTEVYAEAALYAYSGTNLQIQGGKVSGHSTIGRTVQVSEDVLVLDGELTVTAVNDTGIQATNISVYGGKVTSDVGLRNAIYAQGTFSIEGGEVIAKGGSLKEQGVLVASQYNQYGGAVTVTSNANAEANALLVYGDFVMFEQSQDDTPCLTAHALSSKGHAIVVNGNMSVDAGEITAVSKNNRALSVDETATNIFLFNGGTLKTYDVIDGEEVISNFGICARNILVNDGEIDIKVAQNSAFAGWDSVMICGGVITSNSGRGAISSNKSIVISGGYVTALATVKDNAVTCSGPISIIGGTLNVDAPAVGIKGSEVDISGGEVFVNAGSCGISADSGLSISGGKVVVTGTTNPALKAADEISIYNEPGSSTYVDLSGYANVVSGGCDLTISGDKYDAEAGIGTYVKVYGINDHGLRVKNVTIAGGTVDVETANNAIRATESVHISDADVTVVTHTGGDAIRGKNITVSNAEITATAKDSHGFRADDYIDINGENTVIHVAALNGRAMNASSIFINGGTVNTYVTSEGGEKLLSKYGITATTGDLNLYNATVDAQVFTSHALYASNDSLIISNATVNASAQKTAIVVDMGDLRLVDGADVTVEATTGAYGVYVLGKGDKDFGNVLVNKGSLAVSVLNSGRGIQINSGDLIISNGNVSATVKNDIGIEATNVYMDGGELTATAQTWNAIHATSSISLTGGTTKVRGNVNGGLVAPYILISGEDTVVDLSAKANVISGGNGRFLMESGTVSVTSQADNGIRVANIQILDGDVTVNAASWGINASNKLEVSGGTVKSTVTDVNAVNGATYVQSGGVVIPVSGKDPALNSKDMMILDGTIRTYDGDVVSVGGICGSNSLEIAGGTVDINISGNYGINGGSMKLYQKSDEIPTNISATASVWAILASKEMEINGISINAVAKTGRAIQSNGSMNIVNSTIDASAVKDIAIEGGNVIFDNSTIIATANSGKAIYARDSLLVSGGELTATMNNNNAIYVEGALTLKDKAVVNATANNCRSTGGAVVVYSLYMLGEKGDKGPQLNVTMNSAEFKKGELRQIRAVSIGAPTYLPGEAVLEGGNLNITINNNYSDTEYEYKGRKNDVSANRTNGMWLQNLGSINFLGTNVTVDLNTQLNNYKSSGFMWVTGTIPTEINVSDGTLMCDGNGDVQAMFYSEVNETAINIDGGKILGAAKYFWYSEKANQVLTVIPGANINFYNYSGRSVYVGKTNAYNGSTSSWFEDEGVEYLRGCSLTNNTQYLTTGTEGIATQVEIMVQEGDQIKTYVINETYPAYPAGATAETAKAYYNANGVVVLNGLTANRIRANGNVVFELNGVNTVSGDNTHRIYSMGNIVIGGDGEMNVTGTNYVVYSYRGSEIVVKDNAKLNVVATKGCAVHINHNETPTTSVTFTDNAKVKLESVTQSIYIRGLETSVNINGNADVELTSEKNYGIGAYGNATEGVVHKATVNIGGDAKVRFNGVSGIYANGQVASINVDGNAVLDMNCPQGYPFNAAGANPNVNIGGNAKVNIAEGCKDVFNLNSNAVAMEGVKQEASVKVYGKASVVNEYALHCAARLNVTAKNAENKVVTGKSIFHVADEAFVDLNSDGQTIYLVATSDGSEALLKVSDKANLNVTNLSDSGYSAILLNGMVSNLDLTTKGTVNVNASVPGSSGAVLIQHANGGKNVVNITDATVNITNIQSTEKETLNAAGVNTFAGDRSIGMFLKAESEIVIGGRAKVNILAERNGKKYANTAFGLYITGVEGATKMTIKDRAQLNATSGGDANMNLGSGIFVQNCDITVTDNATLRGAATGYSTTGINLNRTNNITVEKYGMAYFTGESNKSFGINGYNSSAKVVFTVTDGGRIYVSGGAIAVNLKTGDIKFVASGMEAGANEEEFTKVMLENLNRNYAKYGYAVFSGELENPRTSDSTVPMMAISLTVLVAAAAVTMMVIRKKKSKAN